MLSLYNITIIAKFELKTLLRSWFLRIFIVLSLAFLFMYDLVTITNVFKPFIPRSMYALPSSTPYINMVLFNLAQAVIAVFLSSDFFKRDRKLNTTEAIYIRSMSNSSYILGKAIGILFVFVILNVFVLVLTGTIHYFFGLSDVNIYAYFLYPLVISLPTLVFIIGLTFFLMGVIKNQAITFIILLGYIASAIFYLGPQIDPIFDYTTMWFPLMYSDFVGFGNEYEILIHRGLYLFAGIGLIFLTILMFKRLPQEDLIRKLSLPGTIISLIVVLFSIYSYILIPIERESLRTDIYTANYESSKIPRVTITDNTISLTHKKNHLECRSEIKFVNKNEESVTGYIFNLNPGLIVTSVTSKNKNIEFVNEKGLIRITPDKQLLSGNSDSLLIFYEGQIDENACYLDMDDERLDESKRQFVFGIKKRYSFLTENYVLLTNENQWYPNSGVKYLRNNPFSYKTNFINFKLNVTTDKNLNVLSQGTETKLNEYETSFNMSKPIPFISLIIGDYEKRSIKVDSVDYSLYTFEGHNYFDEYLNEVGDTLGTLIRELKNNYETKIGLEYKFNRLSLIEVPVQYTTYKRAWTVAQESGQPEMIFLTENGFNVEAADFKLYKQGQERFSDRSNQVILEKEKQGQMFNNFISSTLFDQSRNMRFRSQSDLQSAGNPFSIFPNYYSYVYKVSSDSYPLFNTLFEGYLKGDEDDSPFSRRRVMEAITPIEKAAISLSEKGIAAHLSDTLKKDILPDILDIKGDYLFNMLKGMISTEKLSSIINNILSNSPNSEIDLEVFHKKILEETSIDIYSMMDEWYNQNGLPGYLIEKIENYRFTEGNREKYQVRFTVTNPENVSGVIKTSFYAAGGRGGGRGGGRFGSFGGSGADEAISEQILLLGSKQTLEYGIVLDEEPRRMNINTILSLNLPLDIEKTFEEFEERKKVKPFIGSFPVEQGRLINSGEIIIDNEDSTFTFVNTSDRSMLKQLLDLGNDDEKYKGVRFWNPPNNWTATIHSDFYGKYIHSAHFIGGSDGSKSVSWNTEILSGGYYDVYAYISNALTFGRRGQNNSNTKYHYKIHNDDGVEDVEVEINNADKGWNLLGRYYFSEGNCKVELTDEGEGLIIADAIKWIAQ
ncbi:MAG: hypothetical protein JEY94_15580 [Melioribacteraceae bacterium]|nr:hypothetical protein [Melioribacteraceae bacterium]